MDTLPIKAFANPADWEEWLRKHHEDAKGIWIRYYKKASGHPTINHTEAVVVALCYGWIDSLAKS